MTQEVISAKTDLLWNRSSKRFNILQTVYLFISQHSFLFHKALDKQVWPPNQLTLQKCSGKYF